MLKAIKNFLLPFFHKPCTCGDPAAVGTVTVTVTTEPPRPRPTRPPTCAACGGRCRSEVQIGTLLGMPVFAPIPCPCCGGAGVVPRVVAERIRADPSTVRDYRNAFPTN